ncbi:hypothetical protein D9619_009135 [Psilocybe cf. subviscida]|uniref:Uncharacterized protein n=1 Tax=Psilocybe cf. subviscida TaxID=2480587 RepID=A0A8H5FB03_9AGAR|nr:hypothetical protein D9619_009135 [Psilocybe cf. subviscida]
MDPLSVTLAVVTFATAVKDLVELGQKIHESFAKVSSNYQRAQSLAEDIKEIVHEIEVFCQDHKDALDGMKDFRLAVLGLLAKFRSFEASILPLLTRTGGRMRDRFVRAWDSWRNNNKVEGRILDLHSDTVKVMRRYMMASTMRIEVKQGTNHQETIRGLTGMAQDLAVVRRDVSTLRTTIVTTAVTPYSHECSGLTSDELNRNIIAFAQSKLSTSAPMLRTPDVITEELMTAAYIKLQINSIARTVEKMSLLPLSPATNIPSNSAEKFHLTTEFARQSMSIAHLRRDVVRQVTTIRDLLDTPSLHIISIQYGALALNGLSEALAILHMDHESTLLGNWSIMLMRAVVDASGGGHPKMRAFLALYLYNQSIQYQKTGDKMQCLQTITEAYTVAQDLRNQYREETQFQILYSSVLLHYKDYVDYQQSVKMSVEAIKILEDILDVQAFTLANGEIQSVAQPSSSFVDHLFSSAPSITIVFDYARGLQDLAVRLDRNDPHWHDSALALGHIAVALHRKMVSIHGHVHKAGLAKALLALMQNTTASRIPTEELLVMADECIQLFRELAENNPVYYARGLVKALWVKATTLQGFKDRDTEAIVTWEEVASLARQIVQDSALCALALGHLSNQFRRLKRHDEAVRTRTLAITMYHKEDETQAERYSYLSRYLLQLCHYSESVEAARKSVLLYRQLAIRDPKSWGLDLTEGLSDLAHCLAAMGDSSQALVTWMECVSLINNFLDTQTGGASLAAINRYCKALTKQKKNWFYP